MCALYINSVLHALHQRLQVHPPPLPTLLHDQGPKARGPCVWWGSSAGAGGLAFKPTASIADGSGLASADSSTKVTVPRMTPFNSRLRSWGVNGYFTARHGLLALAPPLQLVPLWNFQSPVLKVPPTSCRNPDWYILFSVHFNQEVALLHMKSIYFIFHKYSMYTGIGSIPILFFFSV